jgi:hypothetical protein
MNNTQTLNRNFEAMAWGAIFIWWGITELVISLPHGVGAIGIGLILLGLNTARSLNGIPTSGFSTTVGVLALVLGVLELATSILRLPFELPIFSILLIVLGVVVLARGLAVSRNQ